MKYKEIRKIDANLLRQFCVAYKLYTCGNNEEYRHLLFDLAEDKENLKTDDIVEIAEDIKAHSDTDMKIEDICYYVAEMAITIFKKDA